MPAELPHCRALLVAETIIDRWWCRRECNPFWRLYCNRDPGASIRASDGSVLRLLPERIYLVPAWVTFKGRAETRIRHRFIHFQVLGLPEPWLRRMAIVPREIPAAVWPAVDPASPEHGVLVQALLCQAVAVAIAGAPIPRTGGRAAAVIAPALRLVDERLSRPPSLPELAAACGVGTDHLGRCFVAELGRTPSRWIRERRVAHAAERLATGTLGVAEAAAELGFANPYHFSRVFRQVIGMPPIRWRGLGAVSPSSRAGR